MSVIVCGDKEFNCAERTLIMGVINVTPDSFSDGGLSFSSDKALRNALRLFEEGADIVDVGGVATSPMRSPVDEEEELRRVLPVIAALVKEGHRAISIDTSSASVAKKALDLGASWINDQHAALLDPHMVEVMKKADGVVLMHNVGLPGVHAGENILYDDVINEITVFFRERIQSLSAQGLKKDRIILDPGIGFGKGLKDSLTIINNMHCFAHLSALTMIGVSRKSFLGHLLAISDPMLRDGASLGATAAAIATGANIVRTHNVKATYDMVRAFNACRSAKRRDHYEDLH